MRGRGGMEGRRYGTNRGIGGCMNGIDGCIDGRMGKFMDGLSGWVTE